MNLFCEFIYTLSTSSPHITVYFDPSIFLSTTINQTCLIYFPRKICSNYESTWNIYIHIMKKDYKVCSVKKSNNLQK